LKHYGVRGAAYFAILTAIRRTTGLGTFQCLALDTSGASPNQPESLHTRYECRTLSYSELAAFAVDPELELDRQTLQVAESKRDTCIGVIDRGNEACPRLLSYGWYSTFATAMNDQFTVSVSRQYIYKYKSFTRAENRGQRLHVAATHVAARQFRTLGYRAMVCYIEGHNLASIRSFERSGFRKFGWVFHWKGTPLLFSPGCRRYRFTIYRSRVLRFSSKSYGLGEQKQIRAHSGWRHRLALAQLCRWLMSRAAL